MESVVGRGTVLAGRYRTLQPSASDLPGATCWEAVDDILDRPVGVTVLHDGHVAQALDAARRAALVADPRLVRVLDVGEHEGVAYTVTERITGPSLAELVARGPLPADQARAIVGEAASALEAARRRGVHHLTLRPSILHLTPDDRVVLTGLAVDGALLGLDTTDAAAASRSDTVGLVGLLYAALTGRWPGPLPGTGDGLPSHLAAAPVLEGAPVPPAELASGVPNDLDTLCAVTLGVHDDGPQSPAQLVQELEPWGDIRATDLLEGTQVMVPPPAGPARTAPVPTAPAAAEPPAAPGQVQRTSVRSVFAGGASAAAQRPGTPPPAVPSRSSALGGQAVGIAAPGAAVPGPAAPTDDDATTAMPQVAPATERTDTPATDEPVDRPVAVPVAGAPSGAAPSTDPPPTDAPPPTATHPTTTPPADATSPAGTSPAGTPAPADDAAEPVRLQPAPGRGLGAGGARESIAAHRFDPTRLVLLLVALAIVLGLFTAYRALTRPVEPSSGSPDPVPAAETSAEPLAQEEPAPEEPPEQEPAEEPAAPPVIASAAQLDPPPDGDQNEHPEAVPLAIDGDPTTAWYTRTYSRPDFGGLKSGVGYAVTLAEPSTVSTVTLQVQGTGGRVEVRATDPATPTQGEVLAEGTLGPETVLTLSEPTETQHLVLWFTELAQTADGSNRIELAEVTVS